MYKYKIVVCVISKFYVIIHNIERSFVRNHYFLDLWQQALMTYLEAQIKLHSFL